MCEENGFYRSTLPIIESYFGKENPGGWDTIGNMESIKSVTQANLKKYVKDHYTASNTVIIVAGNFDEQEIVKKLKDKFKAMSCLNAKPKKRIKYIDQKQELIVQKSQHNETYLTMIFPSFPLFNEEATNLIVFLEVLLVKKGLSSRLYHAIREERGLTYRIAHANESGLDYGMLYFTVPTDSAKIPECFDIILRELKDIKENGISEKEFKDTMLHIEGVLDLASDNFYSVVSTIASQIVLKNKYKDPKEELKEFKAIKKEDLENFAKGFYDFNKMKVCVDGNFPKPQMKKDLKQILNKYSK